MAIHYLIALLVTFSATLLIGGFVVLYNPKRPLNRIFGLYSWSIATWSIGQGLHSIAPDVQRSLWWAYSSHYGVVFIPTLFVHFVVSFLAFESKRKRRVLISCYLISLFFAAINGTPLYIAGVTPKFSLKYFIEPGFFYQFSVIFFMVCVVYGLSALFRARAKASGAVRNQLNYLCWSSLFGYLGGMANFFLVFDREIVPWNPFGTYAVPLYVLATTYAIVRYRLMDINLAITRTAVFLAVYALLLGLPLIGALAWHPQLERLLGREWWVWLWVVGAAVATAAHYVNFYLQRQAEARLLREQRRYQTTLLQASQGMIQVRELQRLLNLIVHVITKTMGLTHAAIFLHDPKARAFVLSATRYQRVSLANHLSPTSPLIEVLRQTRQPLVHAEFQAEVGEATTTDGLASVQTQAFIDLQRLKASVVVPSFREDELIGFLVLGDKTSSHVYSEDDLNVLQTLANQAALAVQNAQFYDELQTKTAELIHESRLKSMGKMASGLSHQIHNRLMVLGGEAMLFAEMYLPKLRAAASEAEREQLMDKLATTLTSISEESVKGKEIVKKLLDFSKPATNKALVSLKAIVEGGLRMVSLNHQAQLERCQVHLAVPDQPRLELNFTQLEDVFFNLFDNALDAIKSKTALLEHQALTLPPEQLPYQGILTVTATPTEDRTRLLIRMADNGLGMSVEDQECLFLPFFTTKGTAEKGTGMGLFIIREILRAHGGDIRLEQAAYGSGTAFLLELPIPEAEQGWERAGS